MKRIIITLLVLVINGFGNQILSQHSLGGIPVSFDNDMVSSYFQEITLPAPNPEELVIDENDKLNLPHRFAICLPVNFNPENSGTWENLKNGGRIWRLGLHAEKALALSLCFSDFKLPKGYRLFIYDENGKQVKGAFTVDNNHENGLFATELISGDFIVLELYQPVGSTEKPVMNISDVAYAYKAVNGIVGFGNSDDCEINAVCAPEGDNWQDIKRSVVRIYLKVGGGYYWCSGVLVNNVRADKTPYILTADHCAYKWGYATPADVNQWIFYFNYESATCENPDVEPAYFSREGAQKIAQGGDHGTTGSDFYLVRLDDNIPEYIHPYYSGWSASGNISNSGVTIHHPEGDIKKISTYNTPISPSQWSGNGVYSHWRVFWAETENDWGATEPGSSGSPLFDAQGRLIGTLTGGLAACGLPASNMLDYYGAFSYHWESNGTDDTLQLKPWLDPDNTGVLELEGSFVGVQTIVQDNIYAIDVFPNPVGNELTMKFRNSDFSVVNIEIINIFGMKLFVTEQKILDTELAIDTQSLEPGIYFIRISDQKHSFVKRIIKK